jgi:ATP-dependent DNA helicase RecG
MAEPPSHTEFPLQYIKGVGPRRAQALDKEGIRTKLDLVKWVPRSYVDRAAVPSLHALQDLLRSPTLWAGNAGEIEASAREVSIVATIGTAEERRIGKRRSMLTATISDWTATAHLVFFNAVGYFRSVLEPGKTFLVSGKPTFDGRWNRLTFTHPELERVDEEDEHQLAESGILPTYPLTQGMRQAGLTTRLMRSIVSQVIDDAVKDVAEVIAEPVLRSENLMDVGTAYRELHFPTSLQQVQRARERMKFEELYVFQMLLALRQRRRQQPELGLALQPKSPHARQLVESLPFSLTTAQKRVIHEIVEDMTSGKPMNRLLQGDVGSGKTIVSLLCMLNVVDNGYQAAIMAPTEILAEQHRRTIEKWCEGMDIVVDQLVGGQNKRTRNEVKQRIADGTTNIIVGTHALFEAQVDYHKLGLVVIDEQHRFGVAQRAELRALAVRSHGEDERRTPHILVMSATPIPRTLSMTLYGDLDVSVIDELPADRRPIRTHVVFESSLHSTFEFVREQVREGRQAYIVYPLVEKSEKIELKSAVEHYERLKTETFPDLRLGLLHGQMLWYEKEDAMKAFLNKEFDVLVATTVIEVGVDVPNATVMLIENAERFGLSQLHQLRGRVGRSSHQSYCFLATKDHFQYQLKEDRVQAAVRLRTMEETTDGFRIAEVDLRLRGPGDLMGTRQSGLPEFAFADIVHDGPIITRARRAAYSVVDVDPHLRDPQHTALRKRLIAEFEQGYQSVA